MLSTSSEHIRCDDSRRYDHCPNPGQLTQVGIYDQCLEGKSTLNIDTTSPTVNITVKSY